MGTNPLWCYYMEGAVAKPWCHYNDVIMSAMASQITSLMIVHSIVYSGADQRKHQSSAPLAFVRGIHLWPEHKRPVTRKIFPFDDVIMVYIIVHSVESEHGFQKLWLKIRKKIHIKFGSPTASFITPPLGDLFDPFLCLSYFCKK